jgi:putative transposase
MSRHGDCYDNACAESFFSTLKNEFTHGQTFATRDAARMAIVSINVPEKAEPPQSAFHVP